LTASNASNLVFDKAHHFEIEIGSEAFVVRTCLRRLSLALSNGRITQRLPVSQVTQRPIVSESCIKAQTYLNKYLEINSNIHAL